VSKPVWYSGFHAVESILRHRPEAALEFYVLEGRMERNDARLQHLLELAKQAGVSAQVVRREALERHCGQQNQGVGLRARPKPVGGIKELEQWLHQDHGDNPIVLVLDGVTDPHNLGACLRTADAVGVTAVVVPRRNACGLTPVVARTAVGGAETVPYFEVNNLAQTLKAMQALGYWVVGTGLGENSQPLGGFTLAGPTVVVMGAEGDGMRRLTAEGCDYLVEIPMRGYVESLNVSVATAVVLYHLRP